MPTFVQSEYILISNREKISSLINNSQLSQEDIIDILISLHLVLEVGLNSFFRSLYTISSYYRGIDRMNMIENIDHVSFIDKTILFIYSSKFDFRENIKEIKNQHKIIGVLRDFCEVRNKLLHGHSIGVLKQEGAVREIYSSKIKKNLSLDYLNKQIEKFHKITEGMKFYFTHLESNITTQGKDDLMKFYLDNSFIPLLKVN